MDRFKIRGQVSSGAHGVIYRAIKRGKCDTDPDQLLAIKRIFVANRKLPLQVLREIKSLQLLDGKNNVVELLDVFCQGSSVNLVFPLLPVNLSDVIREETLDTYQKLALTFMLVQGLSYIHEIGIVHRDIKPINMLITWSGHLKICDFGQARLLPSDEEESRQCLSHQVSTRWYRAPELLYGSTNYSESVDIWSLGCTIAEIFSGSTLFPGASDIEQLFLVICSLGQPSVEWASPLPDYNKITFNIQEDEIEEKSKNWRENIKLTIEPEGVTNLVFSTCCYSNRLTASQILTCECLSQLLEAGLDEEKMYKPRDEYK